MENRDVYEGYDPITSGQAMIASSLAGMDWFGNVINVRIDEETGTAIVDDDFTRDSFIRVLEKVSRPDSSLRGEG